MILDRAALEFAAGLERRFGERRRQLLAERERVQSKLDAGWRPNFLEQTRELRDSNWSVAPIPEDLRDRRVEITGPADRKMIVNALNSGAKVFMADLEDSTSPTWKNCIEGQVNLRDAVRRNIDFVHPETGKAYALNTETATLVMRPRGWHLEESNALVDGRPMSASIFDFAMYFYHNAKQLIANGSGPYFYLPKLENHLEARLWNELFVAAQETLGIPQGSIRATVLIETILASFEMDEILFELREHSSGLNCGRWDYIFSFIKRFRNDPEFVIPERALVGMDQHFLRSYSQLLIKTCHRRGAHAIGGMAAQIPIKNDPSANRRAMDKVRTDKRREAKNGHDGTWVAHPALVQVAQEEFDAVMPGPNQIERLRLHVRVHAKDLLTVPRGPISEKGLRTNLRVGLIYLEAWLLGSGCVPINNLMEDAATAEISRTQVWQWIRHGSRLENGKRITTDYVRQVLEEELRSLRKQVGDRRYMSGRHELACSIMENLLTSDELAEHLTSAAYDQL